MTCHHVKMLRFTTIDYTAFVSEISGEVALGLTRGAYSSAETYSAEDLKGIVHSLL